ncbi:MAG: endonuclease MutS2 [bacterium]
MDHHSLEVLEFKAVKARLASFACSDPGRARCLNIIPIVDKGVIEHDLRQVQEAREAVSIFGRLPLGDLRDIAPHLSKAALTGTALEVPELLEIAAFVNLSRAVAQWLSRAVEGAPTLEPFKEGLVSPEHLRQRLDDCLDPSGEIKDAASPALARIRKQLRREKEGIIALLEGIVHKGDQKALQGDFITIRNERYVIPVKASKKGSIQGIIHDESGSGATLFIEPMISVEAQNSYRRLKIREREEIRKVLLELTAMVAQHREVLTVDLHILTGLDFLQAKALFSQAIGGIAPVISNDPVIKLKEARHALLIFRHMDTPGMGTKPVGIDLELHGGTRALVISGPNTGGKTVTLKMVGLLLAMMQSGLHIPVREGSELGIFDEILADIGDEQDITRDLSSFSSHIRNIARVLKRVGPRSIVLFDELGSDTNPTEGAALGIAVLEYILEKGALCLVTTHHNGLKAYAATNAPDIANASMGFDPEKRAPTFQLHIGYPGSSNALGIAATLGLPREILENARHIMGAGEVHLEKLIGSLERTEQRLREEQVQQQEMRTDIALMKERYHRLLEGIQEREARMAADARHGIQPLIDKARKEIERIVAELRQSTPTTPVIKTAHRAIREVGRHYIPPFSPPARQKGMRIESVSIGQPVYLPALKEKGTVSRVDRSEKKVWVMIGSLKLQVDSTELLPVEERREAPSSHGTVLVTAPVSTDEVSTRLVVIGQKVEDALLQIDKYIDNAVCAHLSSVSIIHGKGTGALKRAVEEFLRSHPQVASFRSGTMHEGGTGVTVVELIA